MARKIDDVAFALARVFTKSGDEVAHATGSVTRVLNKIDPSSVLNSMGTGSYFRNLKLPEVPLRTSSIFQTKGALKNLTNVGVDDLVPASTSDLLTSMSKSIDDIPVGSVDDLTKSLKRVDLDDAAAVAAAAENTSLGKLKGISVQLSKQAAKNTDVAAKQGGDASKLVDDALDAGSFKNADEMTGAMRSSSGLAKKADDAADASAGVAKRVDADSLDDAAELAKKGTIMKGLEFAKRHDGKLSMGIVGAFMLEEHLSRSIPSQARGPEDFLYDPGDEGADETLTDVATLEEVPGGILASDATLLGIVALGAASMVF